MLPEKITKKAGHFRKECRFLCLAPCTFYSLGIYALCKLFIHSVSLKGLLWRKRKGSRVVTVVKCKGRILIKTVNSKEVVIGELKSRKIAFAKTEHQK